MVCVQKAKHISLCKLVTVNITLTRMQHIMKPQKFVDVLREKGIEAFIYNSLTMRKPCTPVQKDVPRKYPSSLFASSTLRMELNKAYKPSPSSNGCLWSEKLEFTYATLAG